MYKSAKESESNIEGPFISQQPEENPLKDKRFLEMNEVFFTIIF